MKSINLKSICTSKASIFDKDYFVGIKIEGDRVQINFPLGYRISNEDKNIRKDIRLLIRTLEQYTNKNNLVSTENSNGETNQFPFKSYLYLIEDFLKYEYIREYQQMDVISDKGKINWNKTIKKCKPQFVDDDAYYLDFVINRSHIISGEFTMVHKYFVHHCFNIFGWLFTSFMPEESNVRFDSNYFRQVLYNALRRTYDDRKTTLINHMIIILNNFEDTDSDSSYIYGTNRFEYVWEKLIDNSFGIVNKKDYFPRTYWDLIGLNTKNNSVLEPDTILIKENHFMIIDAKYYKYGATKLIKDLPNSSDINKQFTYEAYLERLKEEKYKNMDEDSTIDNIFLLPYDKLEWENKPFHMFGQAYSDCNKIDDEKSIIKGIFIDTKDLMSRSNSLYEVLIKM